MQHWHPSKKRNTSYLYNLHTHIHTTTTHQNYNKKIIIIYYYY